METPLFFQNGSYRLFGVVHEAEPHRPDDGKTLGELGVVFCHPFAEEKLIAHRVMVNLARKIAGAGIHCLRFDYMGHGDSDGNFEDATVETRLSDIQCAAKCLKEQVAVSNVGLIGIRFGATLAALACESAPDIDAIALISPIIQGKAYIEQCLRSNLTTQMTLYKKVVKDRQALVRDLMMGEMVNIDGYLLTKALYEQMVSIDLLSSPGPVAKKALLVQISRKENEPMEKGLAAVHSKWAELNGQTELVSVRENFFWQDQKIYQPRAGNLEEAVLGWLNLGSLKTADEA